MFNGCNGIFDFLARIVVFCGREIDVISLPGQRREAHIYRGLVLGVEAAAFVILAFQSEGVEHLDFITILKINTTVAAVLSAPEWLEWKEKFDMRFEVREVLFANAPGHEQMPFVHVPA